MTIAATAHTHLDDSGAAGEELGREVLRGLGGRRSDALILFASARYDHAALLKTLGAAANPGVLVGCSSAGEFTHNGTAEKSAVATGISSETMRFRSTLARRLRGDREGAARQLAGGLQGGDADQWPWRALMVLTDALAGQTDDLIERASALLGGRYELFGGGAGDDGWFRSTMVFHGTEVVRDAAVGLEILSRQPIGIGVRHGWQPASRSMLVTAADGSRLISLDERPAAVVFEEYARQSRQAFSLRDPLPFFLHNILGIRTGERYKLRVPLGINEDGSVSCAADVPAGSTVRIMTATAPSSTLAAVEAAEDALGQLQGQPPRAALMFDCVATRLRTGKDFGFEVASVRQVLGEAPLAGCNTYGQVARARGQFEGFHNCTAVVALLS